MTDWEKFWNEYPTMFRGQDFLQQVCHTVGGKPYSEEQFAAMVGAIRRALELRSDDDLLDLCCGNGLITRQLARACRNVVGIDFSVPLIDVARRYHAAPNLTYLVGNVLQFGDMTMPVPGPFSRISMYGALQHFTTDQFGPLLHGMLQLLAPDGRILIGGVLDAERQKAFLDTPEKRAAFEDYRRTGRDRMGTWWYRDVIVETCRTFALDCVIDDRSRDRPGAHYRFDVLIMPRSVRCS